MVCGFLLLILQIIMDLLKGKRILVVEDEEAERMLISLYLQQQGCRLYHAHDGIDGINKAKLVVPDLILLDVDMPRCHGYAACRVLSEDPATHHIPVIFLSAFADPEHRVQGLMAGAVDFIGKPFNFDEIRLRLAVHLRNPGNHTTPQPQPGTGTDRDSTLSPASVSLDEGLNYLHQILFQSARVHLIKELAVTPELKELASQVGTNTKRLNEAFRHCAGTTVFEYLREERMKEARRLLQNTSMPISEIAAMVGYKSSANFATAFKDRFGVSPSHVRRC